MAGIDRMDNFSLSVGVIVLKDDEVLLVKHTYGSAKMYSIDAFGGD